MFEYDGASRMFTGKIAVVLNYAYSVTLGYALSVFAID